MAAAVASVRELRAGTLVLYGVAWVAATIVGGSFYEYWRSLDIAVRENHLNNSIGLSLTSAGLAENVAYVVVPNALFVPILYGTPTGLALVAFDRFRSRVSRTLRSTSG